MNHTFKKVFVLALVSASGLFANQFTIYNKSASTIKVQPFWTNSANEMYTLAPGASVYYDTGFRDLGSIVWEQVVQIKCASDQDPNVVCSKRFSKQFDIVWSALGGQINILENGSYTFSYSTMGGSGSGTAASIK